MDLRQVSGLARPVDVHYATNRWIAGIALAVLAVAWVWRGIATGGWLAAGGWAALAAIAVFLAWALARELDPDRELAAFVAPGFMLPGLLLGGAGWIGLPDLAASFLLLLAVRVLNRTTGMAATLPDGLGVLGLGLWLAFEGNPVYLTAGVATLVIDGLLPPRDLRRSLQATAAGGAALLLFAATAGALPAAAPELPALAGALVIGGLFGVAIRAAGRVNSVGDENGQPLSPTRVRAGQLLALVAALGAVLWDGHAGLVALLPLWAAITAVGAHRLAANRSADQAGP